MSLVKVIEVIAQSDKGFEDALQNAVTEAARTVRNVKHVYVKEMQALVENNRITTYRVNANISFILEPD